MAYDRVTATAEDNPDETWALVLLDLDKFKEINDTKGHQMGDEVLANVSRHWANSIHLREGDVLARIGGDEFLAFIKTSFQASSEGNDNRHAHSEDHAIEGFIKHTRRESALAGEQLQVGPIEVSIGHAKWRPGLELSELKQAADANMYEDKRDRRQL
jgi:diguanylate cyclase (GGDEF)-like protein